MKWLPSINTETASLKPDSAIRSQGVSGHPFSPSGNVLKDSSKKMLSLSNRMAEDYILDVF